MELIDLNPWWNEKRVRESFAFNTFRDLFSSVLKEIDRRQIQIITGLRRTGKSTIIFQIIDNLIKGGFNPLNIIYCSFDEPSFQELDIEQILKK